MLSVMEIKKICQLFREAVVPCFGSSVFHRTLTVLGIGSRVRKKFVRFLLW